MRPPKSSGNTLVAGGCVVFVAIVAAYPVLYATQAPKPSLGDKPLSGDAIVRGAYVNAGSRDVGPDPNAAKYASRPA